jgi:replication factor C subunit 3/5
MSRDAQVHTIFNCRTSCSINEICLQAALRRTMEKYTSACRFILVCNNACKVIEPVRSRCVCIRVSAPTKDEIKDCLAHVAKKEGLVLPVPLADRIATASNRNLRRAILMLETCKVKQNPLSDTQVQPPRVMHFDLHFRFAFLLTSNCRLAVPSMPGNLHTLFLRFVLHQEVEPADWERYVAIIACNIMEEQSPQRLMVVRGQFYELLACCIPPDLLIQVPAPAPAGIVSPVGIVSPCISCLACEYSES